MIGVGADAWMGVTNLVEDQVCSADLSLPCTQTEKNARNLLFTLARFNCVGAGNKLPA